MHLKAIARRLATRCLTACIQSASKSHTMLVGEGQQRLITQKLGCAALQPAASRQRLVRPAPRCFVAERDSAEGVQVRCFVAEQAHGTQQLRRPKSWQGVSGQNEQHAASSAQSALAPKPCACDTTEQASYIQRLRDPRQITAYIKHRKEAALSSAKGFSLQEGLTGFCNSMDALICKAGSRMNHINFAAVITASAHVWEAAESDSMHTVWSDLHQRIEKVYWQCVHGLQPLLADTAPQQISTVLWSSATLGFNPDECVPGMVLALMQRFLQLMNTTDARMRPNAQSCANLIWAVATMRPPATEVLDGACSHFASLLRSPIVKQHPKAEEVASVVWSLGTLKRTPLDDALLDDLSVQMLTLLWSRDCRTQPNAQATSSMLWGLAELKHAPSHDVGSAMLSHLRALCETPGWQPTSQAISNSLHACAELLLNATSVCVEALVNHLLVIPVAQGSYQHYSNVAWSLAVMGRLDFNIFGALLSRLSAKHSLLVENSGLTTRHVQPRVEEACQLHQALEALKPLQGSNQMEIWCALSSRLQKLVPEPTPPVMSLPGQSQLWAALSMLGVPFTASGLCGMYRADAVISTQDGNAAQIIFMVDRAEECFANVPSRRLGHVGFRLRLLSQHGVVVSVPYWHSRSSPEKMADDIQAAVAAQTGRSLESLCG